MISYEERLERIRAAVGPAKKRRSWFIPQTGSWKLAIFQGLLPVSLSIIGYIVGSDGLHFLFAIIDFTDVVWILRCPNPIRSSAQKGVKSC